jgi:nitrogen regulatory protein PII
MKAVFIPYNQAYRERILDILDRMSLRGFTMWDSVQGRGTDKGEPHYGNHAWPTLNSALLTMIPDEKVDALLEKLHSLDAQTEMLGLHAYVWEIERMV